MHGLGLTNMTGKEYLPCLKEESLWSSEKETTNKWCKTTKPKDDHHNSALLATSAPVNKTVPKHKVELWTIIIHDPQIMAYFLWSAPDSALPNRLQNSLANSTGQGQCPVGKMKQVTNFIY